MSKITPPPYYQCDYCGIEYNNPNSFKYYDSNDGKDICSDKCLERHKKHLEEVLPTLVHPKNMTVEEWMKQFVHDDFYR